MIEFLKNLIFPRHCLFCGAVLTETKEGVFCPKCRLEYEKMKRRACPICKKTHLFCTCVPEKLRGKVSYAIHLFAYGDADAGKLIYRLKQKDDRRLQRFLGKELASVVGAASDFDVSFAPRKPKSIREYGFDQARRLAEVIAEDLDLPLVELFTHARKSALQKNLTAAERAENAEKSYALRKDAERTSRHLILVDDVLTTGSTLAKLVTLAKTLGYETIIVLTVARTMAEGKEHEGKTDKASQKAEI